MTKKTSYSFILALAVISLLFFAPRDVFASVTFPIYSLSSGGLITFNPSFSYPSNITNSRVQSGTSCTGGGGSAAATTTDRRISVYDAGHSPSEVPATANLETELVGASDGNWALGAGSGVTPPEYCDVFNRSGGVWSVGAGVIVPYVPPPSYSTTTSNIYGLTPQLTDPYTQTATSTVSYYITPADLAAGTTTLSYVITTQDSIGYTPAIIGTIIATTSGAFTNTFYVGSNQAAWSAYYTLSGVAGEEPDIGAFFSQATSTFWVNGTSTLLNITTATSTGTTTNGLSLQQCKSTSLVDFSYFACVIGNRLSDVFQWLFIPPQGSLNQYQNMQTTLQTKVPFGYFFLIKNAISGVNASSTSTFTLTLDQGVLAGIITPIRTALSWILLMGFGFWFYMRMKHLDIW